MFLIGDNLKGKSFLSLALAAVVLLGNAITVGPVRASGACVDYNKAARDSYSRTLYSKNDELVALSNSIREVRMGLPNLKKQLADFVAKPLSATKKTNLQKEINKQRAIWIPIKKNMDALVKAITPKVNRANKYISQMQDFQSRNNKEIEIKEYQRKIAIDYGNVAGMNKIDLDLTKLRENETKIRSEIRLTEKYISNLYRDPDYAATKKKFDPLNKTMTSLNLKLKVFTDWEKSKLSQEVQIRADQKYISNSKQNVLALQGEIAKLNGLLEDLVNPCQ